MSRPLYAALGASLLMLLPLAACEPHVAMPPPPPKPVTSMMQSDNTSNMPAPALMHSLPASAPR